MWLMFVTATESQYQGRIVMCIATYRDKHKSKTGSVIYHMNGIHKTAQRFFYDRNIQSKWNVS
jgi:hypothetical protein